MSTPLVSVVLSTCNRGALLRRALRSLYSQSYRGWELVVVADEPTEPETLDILRELKDTGSVIVIPMSFRAATVLGDSAPGSGLPEIKRSAVVVNAGLDAARGEWITYLCDDDVYLPGRFEPYLVKMRFSDIIVGCAEFVRQDGSVVHQDKFRYRYPTPTILGHIELMETIHPANFICHDSVVHRRTELRWPTDIKTTPNDWRFWVELHRAGFRFTRTGEVRERATMPGAWKEGATQVGVLALDGENFAPAGSEMKRIMYAKNVTNKKQNVTINTNKIITVYPNERVDASLVSFNTEGGVRKFFPGFALCGDFSFLEVEKLTPNEKNKNVQTITQTKAGKVVQPKIETLPVPIERQYLQDDAVQPPRVFEPIGGVIGGSVLTTHKKEPKHPFDID